VSAPRRGRARRGVWIGAALFAGWWLAGGLAAERATAPRPAAIPERRELAGQPCEDVEVRADDGVVTRGWWVAGNGGRGAVVLAAGIRGNRLAMVSRAAWYLERGWSVLLVDLRGTGASDAQRVTMGWHEAADLRAWARWLRWRGLATIGAHGQSLGAAAIVYSGEPWDFAVLEACYTRIDEALAARLPWLPWQGVLLWPFRAASAWWMGVDAERLRPIELVGARTLPTLFVCGEHDTKVGPDGARRLFAACGAVDKRLVTIAGAGHVCLQAADPAAFAAALAGFVPARR
jgi:alpha-beta hydrolase superfamily lysophospholipase